MKKILSAFLGMVALAGCTPKSYSMKNNSQVVNFGNFQNNPKTQKMKKKKKKLKNNIPPISDKKDEVGKNKIPPKLENNEGDEDFDATDLVYPAGLLAFVYYLFSDNDGSGSGVLSKVGDVFEGTKNLVSNWNEPDLPLIKNHHFNKTHPIYMQNINNCFFLSSLYTEYDPIYDKLYEKISKKSTDEIIKIMDENSVKSYKSGQWKNLTPEQRMSLRNEAKGKWRGLNVFDDPGTMQKLQEKNEKEKEKFLKDKKDKSLRWKQKHAEGLKKMCEIFVRQKKLMSDNNNGNEKKFDVYLGGVLGDANKMGEFEFSVSPSKNLDFKDKKNSKKNRDGGIGSSHKVLQDLNYFNSLIANDDKTIFGYCGCDKKPSGCFKSLEEVRFRISNYYSDKENDLLEVGDDGKVTINGQNYYLVSISQPDKGWGSEGHIICLQPKYTKSKSGYKISSVLRLGCLSDSHRLYKTESLKDIILKWSHSHQCEWYFKLVHESFLDEYRDYYCYDPSVEKNVDKT